MREGINKRFGKRNVSRERRCTQSLLIVTLCSESNRDSDRQTERTGEISERERQTDGQTDRQTDRQKEREREREQACWDGP